MESTLIFEVRDVYGVPKAYPVNAQAHLLCELTRSKTATAQTLRVAKAMGFTLEESNFLSRLSEVK